MSRTIALIVLTGVLGLGLAAGSVLVERRSADRLAGGLPFVYLVDSPGVSVQRKLGAEDDFRPGWFLADVAVFGVLAGALVTAVIRLRRRGRAAAQGDLLES